MKKFILILIFVFCKKINYSNFYPRNSFFIFKYLYYLFLQNYPLLRSPVASPFIEIWMAFLSSSESSPALERFINSICK